MASPGLQEMSAKSLPSFSLWPRPAHELSLRDGQCPVLAYKRKEEGRKELPRASAQFLGRYLPFYFFIKDGPRIVALRVGVRTQS